MIDIKLQEAEQRRYSAMIRGDVESLRSILDDDLIYTHSNAAMDDKASYISKVKSGYFKYKSITIEDESSMIISEIALLRGLMKAEVLLGGNKMTVENRFLAVLRFSGNCWKLLSYQPTPVK